MSNLTSSKAWDGAVEGYKHFDTFTGLFARDALKLTIDENSKDFNVLDVATGTGALPFNALEMYKDKNPHIVATDFSPAMIEDLKSNVTKKNLNNFIEAKVMDGQNLEVADNTYDYAFSIFGLIMFPDQPKGFRELFRVLKPGGKVGVATWTTNQGMFTILKESMSTLSFTIGPTLPIVMRLSNKDLLEQDMKDAGFVDVVIHEVTNFMHLSDPNSFLITNRTNPGFLDVKAKLTKEQLEEYENALVKVLESKRYPILLPSIAYVAVGRKP